MSCQLLQLSQQQIQLIWQVYKKIEIDKHNVENKASYAGLILIHTTTKLANCWGCFQAELAKSWAGKKLRWNFSWVGLLGLFGFPLFLIRIPKFYDKELILTVLFQNPNIPELTFFFVWLVVWFLSSGRPVPQIIQINIANNYTSNKSQDKNYSKEYGFFGI